MKLENNIGLEDRLIEQMLKTGKLPPSLRPYYG